MSPPAPTTAEANLEDEVRHLLKQLNWVRGRFKVAQRQVPKGCWEYWIFSSLHHALDVDHPRLKKIYNKYPECKENQ